MQDAAKLLRMGDDVTGIRLNLADMYAAPRIVRAAAVAIGGGVEVQDWTNEHVNFFRSIAITKRILFVILSLMVAVAAFNIVSTMVMVVKDKRRDIAILRTFGSSPRSILSVFVVQGSLIGLLGIARRRAARRAHRGESAGAGARAGSHRRLQIPGRARVLHERPAGARAPADVLRICGFAFVLACMSTRLSGGACRALVARRIPAKRLRMQKMSNFNDMVLEGVDLVKEFVQGGVTLQVLRGASINVRAGERIAIVGASGSGKTTLLQLLGGLDLPTRGTVDIAGLRDESIERHRARPSAQPRRGLRLSISSSAAGVHGARECGDAAAGAAHESARRAAARRRAVGARRAWRERLEPPPLAALRRRTPARRGGARAGHAAASWCWRTNRPAIWTARTRRRCSN